MTTEFSNITTASLQRPVSRQLPTVTKEDGSKPQSKPDNIIHLNIEKRQDIALSNQVTDTSGAIDNKDHNQRNIIDSVQTLNNAPQLISRNLEFRVDNESGRTVITVRDTETKEVIRQIPSDQLLAISTRLKELQESKLTDDSVTGILFTSQT